MFSAVFPGFLGRFVQTSPEKFDENAALCLRCSVTSTLIRHEKEFENASFAIVFWCGRKILTSETISDSAECYAGLSERFESSAACM